MPSPDHALPIGELWKQLKAVAGESAAKAGIVQFDGDGELMAVKGRVNAVVKATAETRHLC